MSPDANNQARSRYAEVEAAYTSSDYAGALTLGLGLLEDLQDPDDQPLRMRLLLLLGHTWLYGLGDQESAAIAYRQVAEDSDEQALLEIAADGLSRSTPEVAPSTPPVATTGSAAPWLVDLGPQGDATASASQPRSPSGVTLAPFQQPLVEAVSASPPSAFPGPAVATSQDTRASTADLPPRQATGASTSATPASTSGAATAIASTAASGTPDVATDPVVNPRTLSFSVEEEQELAKGLLLVEIR